MQAIRREINAALRRNHSARTTDNIIAAYDKVKEIGEGAFGTVWQAVRKRDQRSCAIKEIDKKKQKTISKQKSVSFAIFAHHLWCNTTTESAAEYHSMTGTWSYSSPELIGGERYGKKNDVWALDVYYMSYAHHDNHSSVRMVW